MGIVIAYKGTLDNPAERDTLLRDLRQCAHNLGWPCQDVSYPVSGMVVSQDASDDRPPLVDDCIQGIQILPPGTEMLTLTFNSGGKLIQYMEIPRQLLVNPGSKETYYLESTPWVKTTGELDAHVLILVLLRRIKTKYISDLQVNDDAEFWETADYRKLSHAHMAMTAVADTFRDPESAKALLTAIGEDPDLVLEPLDPSVPLRHPPSSKKRAAIQPN